MQPMSGTLIKSYSDSAPGAFGDCCEVTGMTVTEIRIASRYRLGRQLGTGGMGRVWLGHDEILHRDVAVKEIVLPFGLGDDEREEMRLRTMREARAAARLNHPNVVQIYDVGQSEE